MFNWMKKIFTNHKTHENDVYTNALPIVNADGSSAATAGDDGKRFIRIVPVGYFPEHPNGAHDITREHIEQMARNARDGGTDILFDYEHRSMWGDSKAAGWAPHQSVEARDDGLYVEYPSFTASAQKSIDDREFRYLSPTYRLEKKDKKGRSIGAALLHVALTNTPYMDTEIDHIGNSGTPKQSKPTPIDMKLTAESLAKLGLDETATEEQVNAAIANSNIVPQGEAADNGGANAGDEATRSSAAQDPNADRIKTLEDRINAREQADEQVRREALVNSAVDTGKILPADRDVWLNALKTDFNVTKAALDARKPGQAMPGKVHVNSGAEATDDKSKQFRDYITSKSA